MFGLSGITNNKISTVVGLVITAIVAIGWLSPEQGMGISDKLPEIFNALTSLVTVIAGLLAIFYKGKPVDVLYVPPSQAPSGPPQQGFICLAQLLLVCLLALGLLLGLGGCAGKGDVSGSQDQAMAQDSPRTVAYKTLATANKTYTATMKSIADLYKQGLVDDTVKSRAIQYGTEFKRAHDLAISAVEAGDYNSVAGVSAALANLLEFIQPYLIKGGK